MGLLAAGDTLAGRFRLIRVLGEGTTGAVWLAEDTTGARRVAVKIARDDVHAASLQAEFQQTRRLVHPGILRVHEHEAGPPAFLVMPYLPGGNAATLRGASFRAIVPALARVADALEHAHRQGVVHRDLKPSNVLVDEKGRCIVADFGAGAGSLPFMSPQQLAGEPAAASDDVYGFGALLYDLLTGQPPFHPDVTPERIRGEAPAIPPVDLAGEPLPEALRQLLRVTLGKSPAERPPGMGAVRSALEEIAREFPPVAASPDAIALRERTKPGDPIAAAPLRPPARDRRGLSARAVYAGLAALALVAAGLALFLPRLVQERQHVTPQAQPAPAAAAAPAPAPPPAAVSQAALDDAMGAFLHDDDELRKRNAERWGGGDWVELRRLADAGDAAYRQRDFAAALEGYRAAGALAKKLIAGAPALLAAALGEGEAALDAGDQARALERFGTAVAIEPGDARATRGLARAQKLDQVLALTSRASAAEASGDRAGALALYRQAVAVDPAWRAASEGEARLQQAASRDAFEADMARGFAAQARGDLAGARDAFDAALRQRPGDEQATAARAQIETDRQIADLAALTAEARALEASERWTEAQKRYQEALARDPNLADAKQGDERARFRADLDERLRRELGNAERFNDDAVLAKAQALLVTAKSVPQPGPALARQVADLDALIAVARTPVHVTLESDNLTDVTVFKVGRLGAFANRTLELRPGTYTVVGSRPGFRDVRRTFRVAPEGAADPVVVRCEEPI